ncbi:hypothetical protein [Christiangramia sabulilitoris]|uniref:Uncharacterized protein n=1 Tax=Christiangramia sabulilitoris TaxID=2583991 RepID=A0A550I601_9FLAO|nr:hypothetical protein [Christiangramia sabulilitoris]TRO66402.1 hypothetical protein FGM01_00525 [Christiangramia sabulilitoris]
MLTIQDYNLDTEDEFKQICSVKDWIENIHDSGNFFQLPLRTLELIRRFNNLYTEVFENKETSASIINQLFITARSLETDLVRQS